MLAWKVAPAIAAGNSVILKPAEQTSLTALYFAEICKRIKLPEGVVNVVTGDGITGSHLVTEKNISKVDKIFKKNKQPYKIIGQIIHKPFKEKIIYVD